jgi:hypothetical protein
LAESDGSVRQGEKPSKKERGKRMPVEMLVPHNLSLNGTSQLVRRPSRIRKQRITLTLPASLIDRLRNAVYWTGRNTLTRVIIDAIDGVVVAMEEENGAPFPARLTSLKRGRPRCKHTDLVPFAAQSSTKRH